MTTERNIIIHAGQTFELSLDYAGTAGRGQRMHIRASDAAADVIAILSHNGDANARVIYDGTDSLDITIGASVNGGWLVGANRVEWVYDIEDYDLSDTDDVVIAYRGKVIVYGNRTRPEDVTPSAALPSGDGRYVRFDTDAQGLSEEQKLAARTNIGAGTGGSGSGDVVGPASATDDRIAAFDGTTGKLIKQGTVTATAVASHLSNTSNPHGTTAAQVGADPAGTATSAVSTHNSVTAGAHGMTAFGASLVDDADASAARTTLGLGTAATAATGDFAAASHTHAASDVTSGTFDPARLPAATETAQGAVELATTAEALTGTDTTRAVTAAGVKAVADTKAASSHTHAASAIDSGTLNAARLPAPTTTALGGVKRNTGSAGQFVTGIDTDGSLLRDTPAGGGSPGGSTTELQFNNAGVFDGMSGTAWDDINRCLTITGATVTANKPVLSCSQTWNSGATSFTGFSFSVTNTASATNSFLFNWLVGGSSRFKFVENTGAASDRRLSLFNGTLCFVDYGARYVASNDNPGYRQWLFHPGTGFAVSSVDYIGFSSQQYDAHGSAFDVKLYRDAAATLALRDGTNAHTMRVYGTYTNLSNRVNAALSATSTTVTLAAETAGTGADNVPVNINAAGTSPVSFGSPAQAKSYTVATVPSASASGAGAIIYVTDESGGAVLAVSDATNWRRVTDRAVIS